MSEYGLCTHGMDQNVELVRGAADPTSDVYCPAVLGWSLGNEGVPGSVAEFKQLRQVIDALSAKRKPLLVGPESPIMADNSNYLTMSQLRHDVTPLLLS